MQLKLFQHTTITELKKDFSRKFRFLKLEFFTQRHSSGEGSFLQKKIPDNVRLSEITSVGREGIFAFNPNTTVNDFEQRFQEEFGLSVQVFRKAGDLWIETIQTDKLSLDKQNSMGEASSTPVRANINSLFL